MPMLLGGEFVLGVFGFRYLSPPVRCVVSSAAWFVSSSSLRSSLRSRSLPRRAVRAPRGSPGAGLLLRRAAGQGRGGTIQPGIKDIKNTGFKIMK